MLFSTVFQLYHHGQCTYPCFPEVLLTNTQGHWQEWTENLLGKGENAGKLYFLLFPEGLSSFRDNYHNSLGFTSIWALPKDTTTEKVSTSSKS